ncbi:MAG: tRNA pseudouridine(38-40) synthase TruA [Bacteroidales bacterium]
MSYRYFIKLAYNGSRYHGWQIQDNALTVQEVITKAIRLIWSMDFNMAGCGRTDTGVHAREFYAHFDLEEEKSREELNELTRRLNRYLEEDILIYNIFPVVQDLHARFSAISRTYEYHIHTRKDPFLNEFSWFVPQKSDIGLMNAGADILKEYNDFTSFSKPNANRKTNICKIIRSNWDLSDHRLIFTITADRFLHNMVRAIVGTLLDLGQQKISIEDLRRIIESKKRSGAGESVPAKGLYLTRIEYPGFPE